MMYTVHLFNLNYGELEEQAVIGKIWNIWTMIIHINVSLGGTKCVHCSIEYPPWVPDYFHGVAKRDTATGAEWAGSPRGIYPSHPERGRKGISSPPGISPPKWRYGWCTGRGEEAFCPLLLQGPGQSQTPFLQTGIKHDMGRIPVILTVTETEFSLFPEFMFWSG